MRKRTRAAAILLSTLMLVSSLPMTTMAMNGKDQEKQLYEEPFELRATSAEGKISPMHLEWDDYFENKNAEGATTITRDYTLYRKTSTVDSDGNALNGDNTPAFPSDEEVAWSTITRWNGEKIKVLNVYPHKLYENTSVDTSTLLKDWMTKTTSGDTKYAAGRDCFEIDTVYIDDFKTNSAGIDGATYSSTYYDTVAGYDVVFFGTSDRNGSDEGRVADGDLDAASKALIEQIILKKQAKVIFGHDTLILGTNDNKDTHHPYFNELAKYCGIKLKDSSGTETGRFNTVKFTDSDNETAIRLASFPWQFDEDEVFTIPQTHIMGQYPETNTETGITGISVLSNAKNANASYLIVGDDEECAMIQTGDSIAGDGGAYGASDDERKIIANLMFMLGQSNSELGSYDVAFFDTVAPVITADDTDNDGEITSDDPTYIRNIAEVSFSAEIKATTEDFGTAYEYVLAAKDTANDAVDGKIYTNIIRDVGGEPLLALEGVAGYYVALDTNATKELKRKTDGSVDPDGFYYVERTDLNQKEDFVFTKDNTNGALNGLQYKTQYYFHIYPIDGAGNVGNAADVPLFYDNSTTLETKKYKYDEDGKKIPTDTGDFVKEAEDTYTTDPAEDDRDGEKYDDDIIFEINNEDKLVNDAGLTGELKIYCCNPDGTLVDDENPILIQPVSKQASEDIVIDAEALHTGKFKAVIEWKDTDTGKTVAYDEADFDIYNTVKFICNFKDNQDCHVDGITPNKDTVDEIMTMVVADHADITADVAKYGLDGDYHDHEENHSPVYRVTFKGWDNNFSVKGKAFEAWEAEATDWKAANGSKKLKLDDIVCDVELYAEYESVHRPIVTEPTTEATEATTAPTTASTQPAEPEKETELIRLGGDTRIETALEIADYGWDKSKCAILATANQFPDAMAGVPLSKALGDAPILLTRNGAKIEDNVMAEFARLGITKVYILGQTDAINAGIEAQVDAVYDVERIGGVDRFETAVKIADKMEDIYGEEPDNAYFVRSDLYADALSVSSVAAISKDPILYVAPSGKLDQPTTDYVKSVDGLSVIIAGLTEAVSTTGQENIEALVGTGKSTRIGGADRFETSVIVNTKSASAFTGDGISLATAYDFPDALTGGAFAAKNYIPVLLVGNKVTASQANYISGRPTSKLFVFGEVKAVSNEVAYTALSYCKYPLDLKRDK